MEPTAPRRLHGSRVPQADSAYVRVLGLGSQDQAFRFVLERLTRHATVIPRRAYARTLTTLLSSRLVVRLIQEVPTSTPEAAPHDSRVRTCLFSSGKRQDTI